MSDGYGYSGCYLKASDGYDAVPLDVSYACCSDTTNLYDRNGGALESELEQCADTIINSFANNIDDHCNDDYTQCTIDFADYSCDNTFVQNCKKAGGRYTEADLHLRCQTDYGSFSLIFQDKIDCMTSKCSDEEIWKVYRAASNRMDCTVQSTDNIKIEGELSTYQPPSESDGGIETGLAIGIIAGVVVLVIAVGILACVLQKRKSSEETGISNSKSPEKPTVADVEKNAISIYAQASVDNTESSEEVYSDGTRVVRTVTVQPDGSKSITETRYVPQASQQVHAPQGYPARGYPAQGYPGRVYQAGSY